MEGQLSPLLVNPRLTEMRDTVTSFNLPVFIRDLGHVISIFRAKRTNLKLILKRRDEAATFFFRRGLLTEQRTCIKYIREFSQFLRIKR